MTVPENIEELTETAGTMLARNDGAAPAATSPNAIVLDLAALLGLSVSTSPVTPITPPTPRPEDRIGCARQAVNLCCF